MDEIEWRAMCEETAEYLDRDPRFWDQDEGSFPYGQASVYFVKSSDSIVLEVEGEQRTIGRH